MSTTIELQQIHNLARNSLLIHTAMDYVILSTVNQMRILDPNTTEPNGNLKHPTQQPQQITIEDPYFIPKSPIFNLNRELFSSAGVSLEEEFNTGNLPRDLFTLIRSLPIKSNGDSIESREIAVLKKIKLYTDHTSALFIQTSLSYVILYPEKFLALKNLDTKSRLITIQNRIKEKYRDISNAESQGITDFILLLIDTLGSSPDESNIIQLLNDLDKEAIPPKPGRHNWLGLKITIEDIKKFTNSIDLFHRLLNSMNPDLISGIPTENANVTAPAGTTILNDLLRVIIDVQFMEKILDMWRYLLQFDNVTPVIISFLKDEFPKIFGYFEEAKPLPDYEEHIDISRVMVRDYLDTFLKQNIIAKLTELSGRPSSDATLKIFRSLQIDSLNNLPDPNIINFLFTVTFILQENPTLSTLHKRSEVFEVGWDDSTPKPKPKSPRHDISPKIFPGIIFKNGRAPFLESAALEHAYNALKNGVTDLDLRIGQVGQLQELLKTARGVPL